MAGLIAAAAAPAVYAAEAWTEYFGAGQTASRADRDKDAKPAAPAITGPIFGVVSIADQNIAFYGADGVVARSAVSTGMRGHSTPTGLFTIVQKKKFHRSNLYSDAPMPYMQRLTWSGIALHAGVLPGYPASHGCIRMPGEFAMRMFKATRMNQRVVISPRGITPVPFSHPNLPVPHIVSVDAPGEASTQPAEETAALAGNKAPQGGVLEKVSIDAPDAGSVEHRRLNPQQVASAMKREAAEQVKAAAHANKAAQMASVTKATELRIAERKLSAANAALDDARDKVVAIQRRLEKLSGEKSDGESGVIKAAEAKKAAEAAVESAKAAFEAAQRKADEAEAAKTEAEGVVAKAVEAKKAADSAVDAARAQKKAEAAAKRADEDAEAKPAEAKPADANAPAEQKAAETAPSAEDALDAARAAFNAADRALDQARDARSVADKAFAKANAERRAANRALENAQDKLAAAQRRLERAEADKTEGEALAVRTAEAKTAAEAAIPELQNALDEARAARDAKAGEQDAARKALADAREAAKQASEKLTEANRRSEPLSVFISRKTGKLYVRQDWRPVMEAPVSFNEPERQVGTHMFISTHAAADGEGLSWWALSMPPEAEVKPATKEAKSSHAARKQDKEPVAATPPAVPSTPETAAGALDRVIIPEETKKRLAELAWVGATVIVSDHGLSGETGETTDFVILTRSK